MLKKLTPNLMVEDVNETVQFYQEVLDFELVMTVPENGQFDWAMMKRRDVALMFQARASLTKEIPALEGIKIGGSLTFYIDMEGLNEFYARIKSKVRIVQDLHSTFYGTQEFSIQDCNGFILAFAERV